MVYACCAKHAYHNESYRAESLNENLGVEINKSCLICSFKCVHANAGKLKEHSLFKVKIVYYEVGRALAADEKVCCKPAGKRILIAVTKAQTVTYSCRSIADHTCKVMEQSFEGMLVKIDGKEAWSRLIGMHNAYNLLAVYTTAVTLGTDPDEVLTAMSTLMPAPGRLENIRGPRDISVIIDYAHTPDALENVLTTLREMAPERQLICLFGCGGDRDRSKRPEMGRIAQKLADRIIVTSDNSRTEKTADIMAEIKEGMDISGRARSLFIEDREQAIRTAIMIADQGATILLAGKGHETYQIIGTEKTDFNEKEIVTGIFNEQ